MQILVALEFSEDRLREAYGPDLTTQYVDDDLVAALSARLIEVYLGHENHPVEARVLAVGDFTGILPVTLDALEVGAEGYVDEHIASHIGGSVQTMRQMLGAVTPTMQGKSSPVAWVDEAAEFGRHRHTCAKLRDNSAACDCGGYR